MNLRFRNAVLLLGLPLLAACAATAPAAPTTRAAAPTDTTRKTVGLIPAEDLTRYRPTFAAPTAPAPALAPKTAAALPSTTKAPVPTNHVNAPLEQRLRDQAYTNQNVKYTSGYRIKAYSGFERDQAMNVRRQVIGRYPDETDYLTFKQPVYRLYIGDYITKLDAARGLARVRQFAPKAELEPMQVLLNKTP
ncbi:SPOR domain-containing protein [Hymenobacter bucti]|uniref:SPOR domain-containing protein n=1 Tax=Hymenobacter bucti TaxID=1844114 RepID=A0ABW4QWL0_9BACT